MSLVSKLHISDQHRPPEESPMLRGKHYWQSCLLYLLIISRKATSPDDLVRLLCWKLWRLSRVEDCFIKINIHILHFLFYLVCHSMQIEFGEFFRRSLTLDNNHIVPDTKPEEQKAANKASQDAQYSRRGEEAREVRSNSREPRHRYSVRSSHIFGHYPKRPFKHASIECERERERTQILPDHHGCGSGVFAWIRIRFSNFSGSGSGFSPDGTKKECRKVSKSDLSEENLKFMTKDRQKMKKATISY